MASLDDWIEKAKGPIAIGARGGKIYGYDAKGTPIYSALDAEKETKGDKGGSGKKVSAKEAAMLYAYDDGYIGIASMPKALVSKLQAIGILDANGETTDRNWYAQHMGHVSDKDFEAAFESFYADPKMQALRDKDEAVAAKRTAELEAMPVGSKVGMYTKVGKGNWFDGKYANVHNSAGIVARADIHDKIMNRGKTSAPSSAEEAKAAEVAAHKTIMASGTETTVPMTITGEDAKIQSRLDAIPVGSQITEYSDDGYGSTTYTKTKDGWSNPEGIDTAKDTTKDEPIYVFTASSAQLAHHFGEQSLYKDNHTVQVFKPTLKKSETDMSLEDWMEKGQVGGKYTSRKWNAAKKKWDYDYGGKKTHKPSEVKPKPGHYVAPETQKPKGSYTPEEVKKRPEFKTPSKVTMGAKKDTDWESYTQDQMADIQETVMSGDSKKYESLTGRKWENNPWTKKSEDPASLEDWIEKGATPEGGMTAGGYKVKMVGGKRTYVKEGAAPSGGGKKKKERAPANEEHVRELGLFLPNSAGLQNQFNSIRKNLVNKMASGKYDHEKSKKLWMYMADVAAKAYTKEFDSSTATSFGAFSTSDRHALAAQLADEFKDEAESGEWDSMLNKKNTKATGGTIKKSIGDEADNDTENIMKDSIEELEDFAKGGMPTHAPRMGGPKSDAIGGSQDGGSLEGKGKTTGTNTGGTDYKASAEKSEGKTDKLSEDDREDEANMKDHTKPIEKTAKYKKSMVDMVDSDDMRRSLFPADGRTETARERAVAVQSLRKGEDDITLHPYQRGSTDEQSAELAKSDGFYTGPSPEASRASGLIEKSLLCKSCGDSHNSTLTACPGCGSGVTGHRVLPGGAMLGHMQVLEKSDKAPRLQQRRPDADLVLPAGADIDKE